MRLLLEQSAATFDWVLLDSPPVGMMPDARLLAGLTRAVLFVIAARSTPHDVVSRALAEFDPECLVGRFSIESKHTTFRQRVTTRPITRAPSSPANPAPCLHLAGLNRQNKVASVGAFCNSYSRVQKLHS